MLHLIYGPDVYRIRKKINEILGDWKKKHPQAAFLTLDFRDPESRGRINSLLRSESLFDSARVVHFKNVSSATKELAKVFLSKDFKNDDTNFVVMEDEGIQTEGAKSISPLTELDFIDVQFVASLAGKNLENWIMRECEDKAINIGPEAIRLCISRTGNDIAGLMNEISKLSNYSSAVGRDIRPEDIQMLVSERMELNVFNLVDALAAKNKAVAFNLLFKQMNSDTDPHELLRPVMYQFRNILMAKDMAAQGATAQKIAKIAEIPPFVAQKALSLSRAFSLDELKRLYGLLLSLDTASKKGILNLEDELYKFALK